MWFPVCWTVGIVVVVVASIVFTARLWTVPLAVTGEWVKDSARVIQKTFDQIFSTKEK